MKKLAVFATLAAIVLGLIALTTSAPNAPPGEVTIAAIDLDADLTSFQIEATIVHDTHAAVLAEVLLEYESETEPIDSDHPFLTKREMLVEHEMEVPHFAGNSKPTGTREALHHDRSVSLDAPSPQSRGIAIC